MTMHEGGCLCGSVRYAARGEPVRVTICYCTFCQRSTGSTHLVEPIFGEADFSLTAAQPSVFAVRSKGSGKRVNVNFCAACGTKLYLAMERFPGIVGIYGGTFDQTGWFGFDPAKTFCLFLDDAPRGAIIPAGVKVYRQHRLASDGTTNEYVIFDAPHVVGGG